MTKYILFAASQLSLIAFAPSLLTQYFKLFRLITSVLVILISVALALGFAAFVYGRRVKEELRVWK